MASDHLHLLEAAFRDSGRDAPGCLESLAAHLDELEAWSRRGSLTGLASAAERVEMGVVDALPLVDALGAGSSLADVGSGNGLPGLVAAIMRPDVEVTLVEPSAKRAAFLRSAASVSSALNAVVVRERVERLEAAPFDAAVSRAVFPPERWLELAVELVREGGLVYVFARSGSNVEPPGGLVAGRAIEYVLPWSGRGRALLSYERVR